MLAKVRHIIQNINLEWIRGLNVTSNYVKLLKFCDFMAGNCFLKMAPKAYVTKKKEIIWMTSKVKTFFFCK